MKRAVSLIVKPWFLSIFFCQFFLQGAIRQGVKPRSPTYGVIVHQLYCSAGERLQLDGLVKYSSGPSIVSFELRRLPRIVPEESRGTDVNHQCGSVRSR